MAVQSNNSTFSLNNIVQQRITHSFKPMDALFVLDAACMPQTRL